MTWILHCRFTPTTSSLGRFHHRSCCGSDRCLQGWIRGLIQAGRRVGTVGPDDTGALLGSGNEILDILSHFLTDSTPLRWSTQAAMPMLPAMTTVFMECSRLRSRSMSRWWCLEDLTVLHSSLLEPISMAAGAGFGGGQNPRSGFII
jgi:hypothetical protein